VIEGLHIPLGKSDCWHCIQILHMFVNPRARTRKYCWQTWAFHCPHTLRRIRAYRRLITNDFHRKSLWASPHRACQNSLGLIPRAYSVEGISENAARDAAAFNTRDVALDAADGAGRSWWWWLSGMCVIDTITLVEYSKIKWGRAKEENKKEKNAERECSRKTVRKRYR